MQKILERHTRPHTHLPRMKRETLDSSFSVAKMTGGSSADFKSSIRATERDKSFMVQSREPMYTTISTERTEFSLEIELVLLPRDDYY